MFTGAARRARIAALAGVLVASAIAATAGAPPAAADGPGVGAPWVVSLGDSAISGEAGRWAGNTNNGSGAHRRRRRRRLLGQRRPHRPSRSPAATARSRPPSTSAAAISSLNLACSGARTTTHGGGDSRLQAGHRLRQHAVRQGPGPRPAGVRGDPQREDGRGADRRQRLRLRRHPADLLPRLVLLAVVVAGLLQRRQRHPVALHREQHHGQDHRDP